MMGDWKCPRAVTVNDPSEKQKPLRGCPLNSCHRTKEREMVPGTLNLKISTQKGGQLNSRFQKLLL